jgi:hypothetical protein
VWYRDVRQAADPPVSLFVVPEKLGQFQQVQGHTKLPLTVGIRMMGLTQNLYTPPLIHLRQHVQNIQPLEGAGKFGMPCNNFETVALDPPALVF